MPSRASGPGSGNGCTGPFTISSESAKLKPPSSTGIVWASDFGEQALVRPDSTGAAGPDGAVEEGESDGMKVDGKVWTQNGGMTAIHCIDLQTGKYETFQPFKGRPKGEKATTSTTC